MQVEVFPFQMLTLELPIIKLTEPGSGLLDMANVCFILEELFAV